MRKKDNSKNVKINEEMKKLVIARINAQVPSNLTLSIGAHKKISKDEMISHIKGNDEIGKKIVESHIRFLRAQATGKVTQAFVSLE